MHELKKIRLCACNMNMWHSKEQETWWMNFGLFNKTNNTRTSINNRTQFICFCTWASATIINPQTFQSPPIKDLISKQVIVSSETTPHAHPTAHHHLPSYLQAIVESPHSESLSYMFRKLHQMGPHFQGTKPLLQYVSPLVPSMIELNGFTKGHEIHQYMFFITNQ